MAQKTKPTKDPATWAKPEEIGRMTIHEMMDQFFAIVEWMVEEAKRDFGTQRTAA